MVVNDWVRLAPLSLACAYELGFDKQAAFVGVDSTAVETSVVEAAFKLQGQDTGVRFSLLLQLRQSLIL